MTPTVLPVHWLTALVATASLGSGLMGVVPAVGAPAPPDRRESAGHVLPIGGFHDVLSVRGHVFVTGGNGTGGVVVTGPRGEVETTLPGTQGASGMAATADRSTLYVALADRDRIAAVDLDTMAVTMFPTGAATCPTEVALVASRVWFSYGCRDGEGAVGVLLPKTGDVRLDRAGRYYGPPLLAASPHLPHRLVTAEPSLSPGSVVLLDIRGTTADTVAAREAGSNLQDMTLTADGADIVVASGAPYYHQVYSATDLSGNGSYDTDHYPNAVAAKPDGHWLAAGLDNTTDVYLFEPGAPTPSATYEVGGSDDLLARGLAWGAQRLYAVTRGVGEDNPVLHVLRLPDPGGPQPVGGGGCNVLGADPDPVSTRRGCTDTDYWLSAGSPGLPKSQGDAFLAGLCSTGVDGCTGTHNDELAEHGVFFAVTLDRPVDDLVIEGFDPAMVQVGDLCEDHAFGPTPPTVADNDVVTDEAVRYADGTGPWCTGDTQSGSTARLATRFTVRQAEGDPADDPASLPPVPGCTRTFAGFDGDLFTALDQYSGGSPRREYRSDVAAVFRRWVPLCTVEHAAAGTYLVQVETGGLGTDAAAGQNRFSLRATSPTDPTVNRAVSLTGLDALVSYRNTSRGGELPSVRLPSSAAGRTLTLRTFDLGDASSQPASVTIESPESSAVAFTDCSGTGVVNGALVGCTLPVRPGSQNGRWQQVDISVPADYSCRGAVPTRCWVRLRYVGEGDLSDTASWTASIGP